MSTDTRLKVYYDKDIDTSKLLNKKVAVIGYGSQGHGHSLNLKESGVDVKVGLRVGKSPSQKKAENAGLQVMDIPEAVKWADVVMMLVPDEFHSEVYEKSVKPNLKEGQYLVFGHGFSIWFKQIVPPENVNVFMVAPKGPGHLVRNEYQNGRGVPSLIAIHQDPSGDTKEVALAYAALIGAGRAGIIETTFKEETETDLFGEQAVLCGGVVALVKAAFETLVDAGYSPYMAYFECLHELKLIVDLMQQGGITDMRYSVSNTAQYGDLTRGPRVINDQTKKELNKILSEVQDGSFAKEWIEECKQGKPNFNALTQKDEDHLIEKVGLELRSMMPWIKASKVVDREKN
ncbi:MAG: ketol-acid reductoisomerase [Cyanobacteriota bacterium]